MQKKTLVMVILSIILLITILSLQGCGGCCGPEAAADDDDDDDDDKEDDNKAPAPPDPGTPVDTKTPSISPTIPDQTVPVGGTKLLTLSSHVGQSGGSEVTWDVTSSNNGIVGVSGKGSGFTLNGVAAGSTSLSVTLTNEAGRSVSQSVQVTVK